MVQCVGSAVFSGFHQCRTLVRSILRNLGLIWISFFLLPLSSFLLLSALVYQQFFPKKPIWAADRKTILVSSLDTTKGLLLARAFYLAGHHVIGAGIYKNFSDALVPGRYSAAVSEYVFLPDPALFGGKERYADSLCYLIKTRRVDMWACVSGTHTALLDAFAKSHIEATTPCKVLQFPLNIVKQMDSKWDFIRLAKSLALDVPETLYITSQSEAVDFFADKLPPSVGGTFAPKQISDNKVRYVLRTTQVDELSGERQTDLYPLSTLQATRDSLAKLDIRPGNPWIIQEYIPGIEYRTHSLIVNGDVRAFAAAETSGMPLPFQALPPYTPAHAHMLQFTKTIAEELKRQSASNGQLSFDFILRDETQLINLVPINCSPRADTAIVLFSPDLLHLAQAYLSPILPKSSCLEKADFVEEDESEKISCPNRFAGPDGYYWSGNDLVVLLVVPLIKFLTFRITMGELIRSLKELARHVLFWKDAGWEVWDPLPWWWGYHVFWVVRLCECLVGDVRWGKINIATCEIDTSC
ncbi:hypothetical protein BJ508DRAFT_211283 [Ascobolus immersus RN42]|uniref:ATP-grasp domain-containing protein n=1 Tax=Ascobolus immersus RN42 TaxID=1160509 RepID=A0A3N4I5A5_ASCIM|nr:hypothetical protein BJ508DRAFT_211283 [Ascobolus immersus RN42]